ncbi:MAG: GntR family transcriptional regulator [Pleurocapsa sp. SU_196_0]|nr:GntR family transcriptional regulator [Pleurocapsa sp. SU_196_0]
MSSKYPVIKSDLKAQLLTGSLREGEAIPSESALAKQYGVSRMTARRAVDELEREGYVFRIQGAGISRRGNVFVKVCFAYGA